VFDGALAGLLSEYRRRSNGQSPAHHLIARNVGFSINSGPSATLRSCQLCADTVAKVFLHHRLQIFRALRVAI